MVRLVPLLDAKKLADKNLVLYQAMQERQEKAIDNATNAQRKLEKAYSVAYANYLTPFAEQFARIKNVDLGELPITKVVPEMAQIDVTLQAVALDAVQGLTVMAGGGLAGAAVGAGTFAAVGAFATASTGAAIGGLSGAAATSASLAWLGGGSLAAGGGGVAAGTAVLAGVVAFPVLLAAGGFLWWQGENAYNKQRDTHEELKRAEVQMDLQIARNDIVLRRVRRSAKTVRRLSEIGRVRLPRLRQVIERSDDYLAFDQAERDLLAELAGLAATVAAVIACPILDEHGNVTDSAGTVASAGDDLADRLAA